MNQVNTDHPIVTSVVHSPTTQQCEQFAMFLNASPYAHFRQSMMWYQSNAKDHFFVISERGNSLVALSLVRERRIPIIGVCKYFIERGPVADEAENVSAHLKHLVECLGDTALWIRVSPYVHDDQRTAYAEQIEQQGFQLAPPSQYSHTVVVELDKSEEDLWGQLGNHLKRQLKKATRQGISVHRAQTQDDVSQFIDAYNRFATQRDLQKVPCELSRPLYDVIFQHKQRGGIWFAEQENQILAGVAVLVSGKRAVFEWGYSSLDERTRYLPASHCLHWEVINWAKEQGLTYYDLGGYNGAQGEDYGLNRFKLEFSRQRQIFLPEYVYVERPMLTNLLTLAAKLKKYFGSLSH